MAGITAPPTIDLIKELRTFEEFPRLALSLPALATQPRGNRQPVLVLPGFTASDVSTRLLRTYLRYLNYDARPWGLGKNTGHVPALLPQIIGLIDHLYAQTETPVRLVGQSLGGYLAREAARERQHIVHQIITLGSPVIGGPRFTAAAAAYRAQGYDLGDLERRVEERYATPLNPPVTAIYSQGDGIVAWQACIDERSPNVEHIEVRGSHLGMGFNPQILQLIAQRLAK